MAKSLTRSVPQASNVVSQILLHVAGVREFTEEAAGQGRATEHVSRSGSGMSFCTSLLDLGYGSDALILISRNGRCLHEQLCTH